MHHRRIHYVLIIALVLFGGCMKGSQLSGNMVPRNPGKKPTIAIISEGLFADMIENDLFLKGFTIIERNRLVKVIHEQAIQKSGLTEEAAFVEAGKLLNVQALMFIDQKTDDNRVLLYASIKLVDVERGAIIGSFHYRQGRGFRKEHMEAISRRIAAAIAGPYRAAR